MSLDRAPMSCGEFIGHRVWECHRVDGVPTLRSWIQKCFWPPDGVVSDISFEPHEGPIGEFNKRGVWAFKTRELCHEDFKQYSLSSALIYGSCYMWGTIIEHTLGYRAQHARVLTLESIGSGFEEEYYTSWSTENGMKASEIDLDSLRRRYGVDK